MMKGIRKVARYGRSWARGARGVHQLETTFSVDGVDTPGTLFVPDDARAKLPGWVVLHGVTVPGRTHAALVRFARALASTRAVVFTPEIPAWTALELDPDRALPTIEAAVIALSERPETDNARTGLLGFSFGAPQALIASAQPQLEGRLRTVVGFGGYADLHRTLRFLFTGRHEWEGVERYTRPDPYGRWIVGANFLTSVPGFESAEPLARTLKELATKAGQRQIASWEPEYDGYKAELRAALPSEFRDTFDVFAPAAAIRPDVGAAGNLADQLYEATRVVCPALDPLPWVEHVLRPVHLIHGLEDPLIPYTETLRLTEALRDSSGDGEVHATVTALFAHSGEGEGMGLVRRAKEGVALAGALGRVFSGV